MFLLNKIEKSEWVDFITLAFTNSGKKINVTLARKITELMKDHPYYVQQLCYQVWINTKTTVNEKTVDESLSEVLDFNTLFYQQLAESISSTQINFLRAVIHGETKLTSVEVMNTYKLGTPGNVLKNKKVLVDKDIVDLQNKEFAFIDPVFEFWFDSNFNTMPNN